MAAGSGTTATTTTRRRGNLVDTPASGMYTEAMSRHHTVDCDIAGRILQLGPGETVAFIGRCPEKGCKRGVRLEIPRVVTFAPESPHFPYALTDVAPGGFTVPDGHRWYGGAGYMSQFARDDYRCEEHYLSYEFKGLRSTYVATEECGQDCLKAIGATCRCSCGGAKHGSEA